MSTIDRKFFESTPRSALLRNTCLDSLDAYEAVLNGNETGIGALLDSSRRLRELGIVARMHTITAQGREFQEHQRRLTSDPVMAVEWVSGQLLNFLDKADSLAPPNEAILAEHDQLVGEHPGAVMTEQSSVSPRVADYEAQLGFIGLANSMLDSQAGRTELSR